MKIIKINTDLELTIHDFPTGSYTKQNGILRMLIGCYLYKTDQHGYLIMGNILFVGGKWDRDGIDFCGIEKSVFKALKQKLNDIALGMKAVKEAGL